MRSMKKLLSSLLVVLLCLAFLAVPAYAEEGGEEPAYEAVDANGVQYPTLAAAFEAGGNITLSKDVTVGTTINVTNPTTLDLNGKTITSTVSGARLFEVSADFTINGNSGTITGDGNAYGVVRTAAGVAVTINGGTYNFNTNGGAVFKCNAEGSSFNISGAAVTTNYWVFDSGADLSGITVAGGSYVSTGGQGFIVSLGSGASASITGATVTVSNGVGIEIGAEGSATAYLSGNNVTVSTMVDGGGGMGGYCLGFTAGVTATIDGGTYSAPGAAICNTTTAAPAVTVNGGTFNGGIAPHTGTMTIKGGTFNSYKKSVATGTVVINGGTFDVAPAATDIAEGYAAILTDNGYLVHQHNPVFVDAKDPTCTAEGNEKHYFCSACGLYYECVQNAAGENAPGEALSRDQIYSAPVHATKLVEEKAPTCTELGVMEHYECINCSKLFWDEEGNDEITDVNSVNIAYAPHTTTKHDAVPSTCINYGTIEYYECNVCHKQFSDEACKNEITDTAAPLLPHSTKEVEAVEAKCNAPGNILHYVCTEKNCGKLFLDAAGTQPTSVEAVRTFVGHTVTLVEAVEPTLEKDGNIAYEECCICGQFFDPNSGNLLAKEDVIIPKLVAATAIEMTSAKFEIDQYVGVLFVEPNSYHDDVTIGIKTTPENAVIGDITVTVADDKLAKIIRHEWDDGNVSYEVMGINPGTTTVTVKTETGLTTTFELTVKALPVINAGTTVKYEIMDTYTGAHFFTPKADGTYSVYIDHKETDLSPGIFTLTLSGVEPSKYIDEAGKFGNEFELSKNTTYIIVVQNYTGSTQTGNLTLAMVSHTHNLTKTAAVASTCKEQGTVEHYTCAACSKIFADAQAKTEITDTKAALAAHTLTKVAAKDATYTDAGNVEYYSCSVCSKLFSDAEAKTETTLEKVTVPQMIEVVGSKAEVSEEAMDAAIEAAGTAGNVTLDLTKDEVVGEETAAVSSAVIPVASLEKVADAGASLTLTKADATVTMDAKALESIAKAAGTGTVTLVVQEVKTEELAVVQQNAVKDKKVAAVISAELINTATNENIGTEADGGFGGGTVTVQIPFTPEEGYKGTDYTVFYVADNGAVTEIKTEYKDGCLVVALNHFSEYVVVNTSYVKPSTGTNPATGDYGMVMPLAIMLLCGVAAAGLIIGKKKYNF